MYTQKINVIQKIFLTIIFSLVLLFAVPPTVHAALTDSMVGFWKLDDTWTDAHGSNNLTPSGSPVFTTGKINNGVDLEDSSSQFGDIVDNPDLSTGDISFTIAAWVKMESCSGVLKTIISKSTYPGQREYGLVCHTTSNRFEFFISTDGSSVSKSVAANNLGAPSLGSWYYVVAWHDASSDEIGIQVNNGTPNTVATTGLAPSDRSGKFSIGDENGLARFMDGVVDEVGFWKRALTVSERTELYNAGAGNAYPFTAPIADSIAISSPNSYQVFQRSGSDVADIVISGTYSGSPTAIEASYNGGAYQTIDSSPSGGNFSGTLSNQSSGQGTLSVRFTNDTSINTTGSYIGIGDVFVVAGQSNAEGNLTNLQSYSHATLRASKYPESGGWQNMTDPTDSDKVGVGSYWPLLATLYLADQDVPVAFITVGEDGSGLGDPDPDWQKGNTVYQNAITAIQNSGVNDVKAILWHQGEHDIALGTSEADYEQELSQMVDDLQTDLGFPNMKLVSAQVGPAWAYTLSNSDRALIDTIRIAQVNRWNNDSDILAGPSLYDIDLYDGGSPADGVHFRTNLEGQTAANRWWLSIQKNFFGGTDGRGPIITTAEYNSAKTEITLTFTDDTLPLLPAGNLAAGGASAIGGFLVKDNGTPVGLSSVSRIANNQFKITLSSAATGTLTVSMGSGNDGEGATVITDSSTYNLPAETFVDLATTQLDETAPTISNVASGTLTSTGAIITWTTNEDSSSQINYGLTTSYGSTTTESDTSTRVSSHTVELTGLTACTTYHYRVLSSDALGNEGVGTDNTFITAGCSSSSSSSSSSNSSSSSSSAPSCDKTAPSSAPLLWGASAKSANSILLQFGSASGSVDNYALEFGTEHGKYLWGATAIGNESTREYLVKSLSPNTTYYFRVRAGNGCATGGWSGEISAKTWGYVSTNDLVFTDTELTPVQEESEVTNSCQTHTVKSGDSLWSIASSLLGDGNKYKEIIEQNKEAYPTLSTSNNLNADWELKVNCSKDGKQDGDEESTSKTESVEGYKVKVKVLDTDKQPVEGAKVTMHSKVQEAITDKDGIAQFTNVEPGDHRVLIAYENFEGEQSINLSGDVKEFALNVTVQEKPLSLSPLAWGIIGIMGIAIVILIIKRRKV